MMDTLNKEAEEDVQKSTPSGAGEVIATNRDLTTQILLHLSPSLVASLKLVSKQWLSITIDPQFIKSHALRHPPNTISGLIISCEEQSKPSIYDYVPFHPFDKSPLVPFLNAQNSFGLKLLQSCNGLLLCYTSLTEFYICNPATLQMKKLSLPDPGEACDFAFGLSLAFDPKKSPHYKVIYVRRVSLLQPFYRLEVYSSETGLWKTVYESFWENDVMKFHEVVYCNGAVHWLKTQYGCLYFHVDSECMRSTPELLSDELYSAMLEKIKIRHEYFGESNGRLYLALNMLERFTVFEMKEDYSTWFIKYYVHCDVIATKFPTINAFSSNHYGKHYSFVVLGVIRLIGCEHDNEDGIEIILAVPEDIVLFNTKTEKSKMICDKAFNLLRYRYYTVHEYVEALGPVW